MKKGKKRTRAPEVPVESQSSACDLSTAAATQSNGPENLLAFGVRVLSDTWEQTCLHKSIPLPRGTVQTLSMLDGVQIGDSFVCSRTGIRGKYGGSTSTERKFNDEKGSPPLLCIAFLQLDGHCGYTPFPLTAAFAQRWVHTSVALKSVKERFALPSLQHGRDGSGRLTAMVAPCLVDVAGLAPFGLQTGMTVVTDSGCHLEVVGIREDPQSGELQFMFFEHPACAPPAGAGATAESVCSLSPTVLPAGTLLTVAAQRPSCAFQSVQLAAPCTLTGAPRLLDPQVPLTPTFKYRIGQKGEILRLFDTNPGHCKHYFGVVPGQRLSRPHPGTVIGLLPAGAHVCLAVRADHVAGATLYDPNDILEFTGEVVKVEEGTGVIHPTALLPYPAHPKGEWVVPQPPQDIAEAKYCFTFPYLNRARLSWLDTKYAEQQYGVVHGQRFTSSKVSVTFVGIGASVEGETVHVDCFFVMDGLSVAEIIDPGTTLTAYSDVVGLQPANCRPMMYAARDTLPDMPLKCDFPYWGGNDQRVLMAVDTNPVHCMAYYGVAPGQRVNGMLTVVGLMDDDNQQAALVLQKDGARFGGAFRPEEGSVLLLVDQDAKVEVKPALSSGYFHMTYAAQLRKPDLPFTPTFCFPIRLGGRVCAKTKLDVDPQHCMAYFGFKPGQRVDGSMTAVGLWHVEREDRVEMIFLNDDEDVGQQYDDGAVIFVTEEMRQIVPVPLLHNAVFYSIKPENADDPVTPNFKYSARRRCADGDMVHVVMLDADPNRCYRYYGVRPGDRLYPARTVIGICKTGSGVEIVIHYDGEPAADRGVAGTYLEPTGEHVVVEEHYARMLRPPPRGPAKVVTIPRLPENEATYNLTFPYACSSGSILMFDVGPDVSKLIGISHGQRCHQLGDVQDYHSFYVFIGIGADPSDGVFGAFFELEGDNVIGVIRAGTAMEVYEEVMPMRPASTHIVTWQPIARKKSCPLHCTVPYPVGEEEIRTVHIDVDPARCKEYFGIVPGQRVDFNATFVGMAPERKLVHGLFHKDGAVGAIPPQKGSRLAIEDGVVIPIHSEVYALGKKRAAVCSGEGEGMVYHESRLMESSASLAMSRLAGVSVTPSEANKMVLENIRKSAASSTDSTEQVEKCVLERLKEAGYSAPQETLQLMKQFLCHEVPLVTWFKPFKMLGPMPQIEAMTNDICLRNLFEVHHGNGSECLTARHAWEARLFGDVYNESSPVCEWPKYGVANIFNDPKGPQANDQYGDCYLVFSPALRPYTTMTPMDSSSSECTVCTLEDGVSNVLSQFRDDGEEVVALADVTMGVRPFVSSSATYYKEVQVHVPVLLDQHITHLVVPNKYFESLADAHMLLTFCLKNGCWLVSINTVTFLASLRLLPSAELQAMAQRLGLDQPSRRGAERSASCLLCGPPRMEDRRVYDAICDYYCMLDTRTISQWVMSSTCEHVWNAPPLPR